MGLILMRLIVGMHSVTLGVIALSGAQAQPFGWMTASFEILTGATLLIGFLTPLAGASAASIHLFTVVSHLLAHVPHRLWQTILPLDLCAISIALVLLGPGAFSLDARLFGRREIIIPRSFQSPPS
jgi:uncharacterized membrane protein YphA (DoxX/SURF4 family)